eukprot:gene21184-biopygen1090
MSGVGAPATRPRPVARARRGARNRATASPTPDIWGVAGAPTPDIWVVGYWYGEFGHASIGT